jgi:endonuclease/exonuclease/phosphatase family metal-dependent hydrolase
MIKKLKSFTLHIIAGANFATIIVMLFTGYADRINPTAFPLLSNAGLAFPIFLFINFAFLVFWLIFKTRWGLIPFIGFLLCYGPARKYCPLNIQRTPPADAIKVLSYNVWYFAGWEDNKGSVNPILEYIREQDADIVCLQESATNEVRGNQVDSILNPIYQYRDTARRGKGDCISIFSKFPILSKEHIPYQSKGNISAAFKVLIGDEEVLVVNNHLETTGLTHEEKTQFKTMMKGEMKADTAEMTSKMLVDKLAKATAIRAPQAEAVARYIAYHRDMPVIVCGDFNDSPLSYAHRTIAKNLTDCYIETGNGPGISYHHNGFYVRIDNIMCSSHFQPYACRVDNKIKNSDHYPIYCWLKMRPKAQKMNN